MWKWFYSLNASPFHPVIVFLWTLSIQEFVKGCGSVTKRWVDELLDKMTAGDHTKAVTQIRQVYVLQHLVLHPPYCQRTEDAFLLTTLTKSSQTMWDCFAWQATLGALEFAFYSSLSTFESTHWSLKFFLSLFEPFYFYFSLFIMLADNISH